MASSVFSEIRQEGGEYANYVICETVSVHVSADHSFASWRFSGYNSYKEYVWNVIEDWEV